MIDWENEESENNIEQPILINSADKSDKEIIFLEHTSLNEVREGLKERGFKECHTYKVVTSQYYVFSSADGLIIIQTDNLSRTLLMFKQVNFVRVPDMLSEIDRLDKKENAQFIQTDTLLQLLKGWLLKKLK